MYGIIDVPREGGVLLLFMMSTPVKVSLWNLRGMGDASRSRILCRWVNNFHPNLEVLCLQELKAQQNKIDFQLNTLFPHDRFTMDYSIEGRAGVAIGVLSNLPIIDQGVKGDGEFCVVYFGYNCGSSELWLYLCSK